tara:strand:+ start:7467 stop:8147 length:681 start_codon:yes stop_codon:yes gene_type:complete
MYQNNIIGQTAPPQFNPTLSPLQQARASGVVQEYKFISFKPKAQLKELKLVLKAEPKKFLGIKYGKKFNLKDRCVVCGFHHIWEQGDYMRPPMPLDGVTKGRPLMGTYCPKHASIYIQLEMLQQQILADKHGLEFSAFKPRMPKILKGGPIKTLSKEDVMSLTSAGWFITPPALGDSKTATDEVIRLITEINIMTERLNHLMLKHNVQALNELPQEEGKEELVKEA